jgi:purine-binding chemotaxis protein CheW
MVDVQLCAMEVGGTSYVIDLLRVEEIVHPLPVVPVPRAPPFVKGVVPYRGDVVPVVDVRERMGVARMVSTKERLVVCRVGRRRLGLLVDAVRQVLRVSRYTLRASPLAAAAGSTPFVLGVCGDAPKLHLLLDVKALVEE